MATIEEMKNVLKDTLEERGILAELRARLRAEIFNSLNDKPANKPTVSQENLIINELIKEYLIFNNYTHSLSVFLPESGQPEKSPFDRSYITKKLRIQEDSKSKELPLLYGLTFGLKQLVPEDEAILKETNVHANFPKKDQILIDAGNPQSNKKVYEDIFNVDNNPRPFIYKS